jgi:hypothetical protein
MTNSFSKPIFTDDKLVRESLTAAIRTIPKDVPLSFMAKWRLAKEKYEALMAKHPLMWKRLFDSEHEDDDDDWDDELEGLLTEEYSKFWDYSEKVVNAGGRAGDIMEIIKYGKKNQLKYQEGKFMVLYA